MNPSVELQQMLQVLVHRGDYAGLNALFPKALDQIVLKLNNDPNRSLKLPKLEIAHQQGNWHLMADLVCELLDD